MYQVMTTRTKRHLGFDRNGNQITMTVPAAKPARETADQAYQRNLADLRTNLAKIAAGLERHATEQAAEPRDWGYAGDLSHVNERLNDIASFLMDEN